jgi:hypothetical protein
VQTLRSNDATLRWIDRPERRSGGGGEAEHLVRRICCGCWEQGSPLRWLLGGIGLDASDLGWRENCFADDLRLDPRIWICMWWRRRGGGGVRTAPPYPHAWLAWEFDSDSPTRISGKSGTHLSTSWARFC